MIFNKKITLYLNGDSVQMEDIAEVAENTDDFWVVNEELGQFYAKCNCGQIDCIDAEVQ